MPYACREHSFGRRREFLLMSEPVYGVTTEDSPSYSIVCGRAIDFIPRSERRGKKFRGSINVYTASGQADQQQRTLIASRGVRLGKFLFAVSPTIARHYLPRTHAHLSNRAA